MLRCALCHSDLPAFVRECGACGTLLHTDCARELGRCPTLGCDASLRPKVRKAPGNAAIAVFALAALVAWVAIMALLPRRPEPPVANVLRISAVEWMNRRYALALELRREGRVAEALDVADQLEFKWWQTIECDREGPRAECVVLPRRPRPFLADTYITLGCFDVDGEPCHPGRGWRVKTRTIENSGAGRVQTIAEVGDAIEELRSTLSH